MQGDLNSRDLHVRDMRKIPSQKSNLDVAPFQCAASSLLTAWSGGRADMVVDPAVVITGDRCSQSPPRFVRRAGVVTS